jgi:hypothetical protein
LADAANGALLFSTAVPAVSLLNRDRNAAPLWKAMLCMACGVLVKKTSCVAGEGVDGGCVEGGDGGDGGTGATGATATGGCCGATGAARSAEPPPQAASTAADNAVTR